MNRAALLPLSALLTALAPLAPLATLTTLTPMASAAVRADDHTLFQKLLDERAASIVSIKFILKGGDQDEEAETTGVVIDGTSGLVLTSNNAFGGLMARYGGPAQTPTDIKVLVGEDTQGVEATFMARDSELGLAWVKFKEAPAKPIASVDFEHGATAKIGDPIFLVSQMGKFFDRAPSIAEGHIGAVVKKPRELLIPSIGLASAEMGLPVFNEKGEVLGISTLILPEQDEVMGSPGGMRAAMRGITGGMILPAKDVANATKRAKETAGTSKPADSAAPADTSEKAPDAKADPKADQPK